MPHTSQRRRLLVISTEYPPGPGGIGTHAYEITRHLATQGWDVTVFTPQDYITRDQIAEFNASLPFSIHTTNLSSSRQSRMLHELRVLWRLYRNAQPTLVMATGAGALLRAAMFTRFHHCPFVAVIHGSEIRGGGSVAGRMTAFALQRAVSIVSVSEFTARLLREKHAMGRGVIVIPNGADARRFKPGLDASALRKRLELEGKRVLLTVGNVTERKAQDTVARALPLLLREYPDLMYVVAGLPTRGEELMALARSLGVERHVLLTGPVSADELPLYYTMADLFILVSRATAGGDVEGYGIVAMEAQMCGTPCIVSSDSGLAEAVDPGVTGLTVPPDDPPTLAGAIHELLVDAEKCGRMSQAALRWAAQASWEQRAHMYDEHLSTIVTERS